MSDLAVGLMSGTSLDGVSAALVRIEGQHRVELLHFRTEPYAPEERERIRRGIDGGTARDLALLNVELGDQLARAAIALLEAAQVQRASLSFIASHGQTIWHEPRRATLQLGDPAVIAERLGVRVVSDFRSRDVAAGGEGAPLVPIADALLFGREDGGRALLNLGGIANVSWVPRRGDTAGVLAFDTGPGVAVIDAVARAVDPSIRFDEDGRRAARGQVIEDVVSELLQHPFFAARPPKSTGREVFGDVLAQQLMDTVRARRRGASGDDCLATAARLTVRSVAEQLGHWLKAPRGSELLVSGGGARNQTVLRGLAEALPAWSVRRFSDVFFDGEAKEAVAFALIGWLTLAGLPGNVPSATGAQGPRVLGRITPA
ncbi:MAG: anhydro-N-acetylmuramic acid kinase [Gemmatimonadetes bacterium]|nr:anhydro-N-acetylmuramic acid kinase [Gemmatimonadota bacterium]